MVEPAAVCLRWQPVPRDPADSGVLLGSEEGIQDEPTRTRPAERVRHTSTHASDDFSNANTFSRCLCLQVWSDVTMLGGETSVQTHLLLTGCLRGQHAERWLQKGTRVLYPRVLEVIANILQYVHELFLCQRYHNLAENFLKGEQPAVLRSRAAGEQNQEADVNGRFTDAFIGLRSPEFQMQIW